MKKIFFFFNWEFTHLCHAFAIQLNNTYSGKFEFCGFVAQKKDLDFLNSQNEVKYSSLGSVPDAFAKYKSEVVDEKYIEELEKKYGMPNLWPFIYADRDLVLYNKNSKYSNDDYLKITQAYFRYIEKMLSEAKPDCVVIDVVASMPCHVLFWVAKKMGIKVLLFNSTRTASWITFSETPFDEIQNSYDKFDELRAKKSFGENENKARDFITQFRETGVKPEYLTATQKGIKSNSSVFSQLSKIARVPEYLFQYYFGRYKDDPAFKGRDLTKVMQDKITNKFRKIYLERSEIFKQPNYEEKYVFFPLHYEPETATMIMAPMYIDQIAVIENISKSLPLNYKLYVKEHPVMAALGMRDFSYYERLMKIPNIVLIDPRINSKELIKSCKILITITGTAGWEAILFKKPAITLGSVFYNKMEMVKKCKSYNDLPYLVKDVLENYKHDEDELITFLSAIFETSFSARFYEMNGQAYVVDYKDILKHPDFPIVFDFFFRHLPTK